MRLTVPEILNLVEKAEYLEHKHNVLRHYEAPHLRGLMRLNFDPNFKMLLPEGEPPFKKDPNAPLGYQEAFLETEWRRFYIWFDPNLNIKPARKEELFINLLEGLHHTEATLLCKIKDKKLQEDYPSITYQLIKTVYPTAIP